MNSVERISQDPESIFPAAAGRQYSSTTPGNDTSWRSMTSPTDCNGSPQPLRRRRYRTPWRAVRRSPFGSPQRTRPQCGPRKTWTFWCGVRTCHPAAAALAAGMDYFEVMGVGMFLDRDDPNPRHAVHLHWSGEKVRPEYPLPSPTIDERQRFGPRRQVVSLSGLVPP